MNSSDDNGEREAVQQDLVARYEALLDKLRDMVVHAKAGQWANIIEQETEYLAELEHLRFLEADTDLDEAMQFHRARLGREILEHSAELKRYLTERREVLAKLIERAEGTAESGDASKSESEDRVSDTSEPDTSESHLSETQVDIPEPDVPEQQKR